MQPDPAILLKISKLETDKSPRPGVWASVLSRGEPREAMPGGLPMEQTRRAPGVDLVVPCRRVGGPGLPGRHRIDPVTSVAPPRRGQRRLGRQRIMQRARGTVVEVLLFLAVTASFPWL